VGGWGWGPRVKRAWSAPRIRRASARARRCLIFRANRSRPVEDDGGRRERPASRPVVSWPGALAPAASQRLGAPARPEMHSRQHRSALGGEHRVDSSPERHRRSRGPAASRLLQPRPRPHHCPSRRVFPCSPRFRTWLAASARPVLRDESGRGSTARPWRRQRPPQSWAPRPRPQTTRGERRRRRRAARVGGNRAEVLYPLHVFSRHPTSP